LIISYANEVLLKKITFNSTNNPLFAPITDAEAMRLNGTTYARDFNLTVNQSTLEGYVFQDNNNNGSYEPTNDTPLPGINVVLNDYYFGRSVAPTKTDAQGHYIFTHLYPSKYNISAVDNNGFTYLERAGINVEPDHNWQNITKPKLAEIKGVTYYNKNSDSKYNPGEEVSNVHVLLNYTRLDGTQMPVSNVTTGASGAYSFTSLIPGKYIINTTKQNSTTGYLDYSTSQTVTLSANRTSWVNISLAYATVNVSGHTTHDKANIEAIAVTFAPDKTVKNNSAIKQISATSDPNGLYIAFLPPGFYNVTVKTTSGLATVYTFSGKLALTVGQGIATYDINLSKESISVYGAAKYLAAAKANVSITFSSDTTVEDNTALRASTITDNYGAYTVELAPGSYIVNATGTFNETGQNFTYKGSQKLTVHRGDTATLFDILLSREQAP
jgi:protocatechuate 3,4-dioxygenase beta subunit